MKSDKILILSLIFIAILFLGILYVVIDWPWERSDTLTPLEIEWIAINPPPNQEGPCWAYFSNDSDGYYQSGYSGVWCEMQR